MPWPPRVHLSARARLTLLYTSLFLVCGAALIAVTYTIVAQSPDPTQSKLSPADVDKLIQQCEHQNTPKGSVPPDAKKKCVALYATGVRAGASAQRIATLDNLLLYSLFTLAGLTVVAALLGWFVAGRILKPIHQLTAAAREASESNLSTHVKLQGRHDELRELADTFDDMLVRLDDAFRAQRQFIANAGHELRTPLAVMRTAIDVVLAKPHPTAEEIASMCREVSDAIDGAQKLIDALLTLARNEQAPTVTDELDLAVVVEDCLDARSDRTPTPRARLHDARVVGNQVLLERLVGNLLDNAQRYNVPDGTVSVTTDPVGTEAILRVENTGPVVAAADVERLFLPFTRAADRTGHDGYGLGLALVRSIAKAHAGTVTATPRVGGGLVVEVHLPAAPSAPAAASGPSDAAATPIPDPRPDAAPAET